jgi:hypothetical protein
VPECEDEGNGFNIQDEMREGMDTADDNCSDLAHRQLSCCVVIGQAWGCCRGRSWRTRSSCGQATETSGRAR